MRYALLLIAVSLISTNATAEQLAPFFDSFNNPVRVDSPYNQRLDRTPPRKRITPFGDAVLRVCGKLGAPVRREQVHSLFENPEWEHTLARVHDELFPNTSRDQYLRQLTHIWTASDGFRHIFCGDPGSKRMRGLHYHGRFAQLQSARLAGILHQNKGADEVVPGLIYSIPMQHRWKGKWVRTPIKSYGYTLDASHIVYHATRAARLIGPRRGKRVCRVEIKQDSGARFEAVVVVKGEGLLTFYPDATPPDDVRRC